MQVTHESKIADHMWLKIVLGRCKVENKYREYSARNYRELDVEKFVDLCSER